MDKEDEEKIEKIIRDRSTAHETLIGKNSASYRAFLEMEKIAYCDGSLPRKYKELIAVGISIIMNCESCLQWHIQKALDSGAAEDQIMEAIGVGIEMGGGPATVATRFALKVLEYYRQR
jgi:AhpD family alkylhydroperoxidase